MMGQHFRLLTRPFSLFQSVIEKEIDEDRIDLRLRMLPQDLSPNQLDTPDAAASKLDFTVLTRGDLLLVTDATIEWRTVQQTSERIEHLRNAIVGKHGDLVDVMKTTITFAIEAGPQISNQDLRSLVETD